MSNKTREEKALQLLLLQYGYDIDKDRIISGGYLSEVANSGNIALQIARFLNQSIATRMPEKQFRQQFRQLFLNPGKTGLVEEHFKRFTNDIFVQFDRSSQLVFAQDLGLTHFIYAGTVMKNTRPFCEARVNKIYTIEEAQKWQNQNWKGKIPGVDFFIQCGGYQCRHHLNFISDELAERIASKRGGINSFHEIEE